MARTKAVPKKRKRDEEAEQQDQEAEPPKSKRRDTDTRSVNIPHLPNEIIDQIIFELVVDEEQPVYLRRVRATRQAANREVKKSTVKSDFTSLSLVSRDFHTAAVTNFFRHNCFGFLKAKEMQQFFEETDQRLVELITTLLAPNEGFASTEAFAQLAIAHLSLYRHKLSNFDRLVVLHTRRFYNCQTGIERVVSMRDCKSLGRIIEVDCQTRICSYGSSSGPGLPAFIIKKYSK